MLKKLLKKSLLFSISLLFLTNCDKNNYNVEVETESLPSPLAIENKDKIEPGAYCFESPKNQGKITTTQLLVASDYSVTGIIESLNETQTKQLNNKLEYREFVAGILNDQELEVTINREKEAKNKVRQETWILNINSLITSKEIYQKINCEKLIK
jgi:uncharacterized lipoprotein YajG